MIVNSGLGMGTALALDRYKGRFSRQEPRETRHVEVAGDRKVDELCKRYETWRKTNRWVTMECYDAAVENVNGLGHKSTDVANFSVRIRNYSRGQEYCAVWLNQ